MAQRVQVLLVDDVDGGTAEETMRFGLDGVEYEIDLSGENAAKMRADLAQWVEHARRTGGRRGRGAKAAKDRGAGTAVRSWLREQGHQVSDRGRIPRSLQSLYDAAH